MKQRRISFILAGLGVALATGCAGPRSAQRGSTGAPAVDAVFARHLGNGLEAYRSGSLAMAEQGLGLAVSRARAMNWDLGIAQAGYPLAAVRFSRGALEGAKSGLDEVAAAYLATGLDEGEVHLLAARIALAEDRADDALVAARRVAGSEDAKVRRVARLQEVHAHLALGNPAAARGVLDELEAELPADAHATRAEWSSLAASLEEQPERAAARWEAAAEQYRVSGAYGQMAERLSDAGAAWMEAGQPAEAMSAWFQAARSFQGLGEQERAEELAGQIRAHIAGMDHPLQGPLDALFP